MKEHAEKYAIPSGKWIGARRFVTNLQNWKISNFPGGIYFLTQDATVEELRVILNVYREDKCCERFISDAYPKDGPSGNSGIWHADHLPIFPYESLHGRVTHIAFAYFIRRDGKAISSKYEYYFGVLEDFYRERVQEDDFDNSLFKKLNDYTPETVDRPSLQKALAIIYRKKQLPVKPFFTRGNAFDTSHPVNEIHRLIDWVINRKAKDPDGRHYIKLALFDFDNQHIADHLVYAFQKGVEVECVGDWASVSSMNCSEYIATLRRAGIPIYGVVRNTPGDPAAGIASMHTKIIIFDGEAAHSSSYNLHFHLWGGNWENALFYYSKDFALLYESIYNYVKGSVVQELSIKPQAKHNSYYSFGKYNAHKKNSALFRPQDAILTEITAARESIVVCMFDMDFLSGIPLGEKNESDVVSALISARDRGVKVKVILNGMIAHTGKLPEAWDKNFKRPLKEHVKKLRDSWMDVSLVYYHESIYSPLHHKFAVIDCETVITGSYNWYTHSIYSDEILTVLRDKKIALEFLNEARIICEKFRLG